MAVQSPFQDPAQPILAAHPAITDDQRADLWDIFHGSKDAQELATKLQPVGVPDDLKQSLFEAKTQNAPAVEPVAKAISVLKTVAGLDPRILDAAEGHPNVTKALLALVKPEEKAVPAAQAGRKEKTEGTQPAEAKLPEGVQADVPATPSGHGLVRGSNGALHHIPVNNLARVKEVDPGASVLHIEP
jgi:hypothetical protein